MQNVTVLLVILIVLVAVMIFFLQTGRKKSLSTGSAITHAFRLKPGQDLLNGINEFVRSRNIEAGYILTCAGSLTQFNLRFANQPEGSAGNGHFEIVNLSGTVSINGSHMHMSISDSTGKTIGGHLLKDNIIFTTAEIVIGENKNLVFTREKDGSTPWEELQIRIKT
jgi:predicted DNA-binding protein with PD1-like motif